MSTDVMLTVDAAWLAATVGVAAFVFGMLIGAILAERTRRRPAPPGPTTAEIMQRLRDHGRRGLRLVRQDGRGA